MVWSMARISGCSSAIGRTEPFAELRRVAPSCGDQRSEQGRQRIQIKIATTQDDSDSSVTPRLQGVTQSGRDAHGGAGLNDEFGPFHDQPESGSDRRLWNRDDVVDEFLNNWKSTFPERGAEAIGNGLSGITHMGFDPTTRP